jgi:DNA polymerase-1
VWHYITTEEEMWKSLEIINRESFEPFKEVMALDVETNGLNALENQLLLVQIGVSEDLVYIYDARALDMTEFFSRLSSHIRWLFHNGKFDIKFLKKNYGWLPEYVFDTMIAESLLTAGIGKIMSSLNDLTFKYLNVNLVKEIRNQFQEEIVFFTDQQLNYAADDVIYLLKLYPLIYEQLIKKDVANIAYNIEFPLVRILAEMELLGVGFDQKLWMKIYDLTNKRQKQAEKELREMLSTAGTLDVPRKKKGISVIEKIEATEINLNSIQQVLVMLNTFGIKVDSTGSEALSNIHHPVVEALLKNRKLSKRLSAFGQSYIDDYVQKDGKIHAGFNQIGAATGRESCEQPNLQQCPNPAKDPSVDINYRLAFIADPHCVLIKSDYSQVELRIATELSQEPEFLEAYRTGKDMHKLTASKVFHIPYDEVTKDSRERTISKNINFASLYGSGPSNLVSKFQVSMKEARTIVEGFHAAYPILTAKLKELGNEAVINGYATTILGRRRYFTTPSFGNQDFEQILSSIKREGANHAIQGTSADMTKLAKVYLYDALKEVGGNIIIAVHDEIVCQVPEEFAERGEEIVRDCMIRAGESMIKTVPIEVDVLCGKSWGG